MPLNALPNLVIREAHAGDVAAMRKVERRAAWLFEAISGYEFCATADVRDVTEHQRVLAAGKSFAAEVSGAIVGFAMIEPLDGEAHLIEIDVDPDYQRQGLARRLIDAACAWARSQSLPAMTLTTHRDIPWNAPFYARLGFVAFEPEPDRPGLRAIIQREMDGGLLLRPGSRCGRRCK